MNSVKRISVAIFGIFIMVSWIIGDIGWSETQQEREDNKYEAVRLRMVEQQIENRTTHYINNKKNKNTINNQTRKHIKHNNITKLTKSKHQQNET